MTKCTACEIEECERSYANKGKCVGTIESIDCSCTCRVSIAEEIGASVASVGAGIAAVVGGVVITAATEGAALAVGGGALIGAGSSLIVNPIQKKITGESMSWSDVTTDAVVGAAIGAITGPIGSVLSGVAKGSSEVVKGGVRVGAGAIAGAVSETVSETARAIQGEEVSAESYAKAIAIGAAAGSIGGASTHVGSNASKHLSKGAGQAATRVGMQATTAAATDAGLQYIESGEVDLKKLALNTVGQVTIAATGEISHRVGKNTNAYAKKTNSEMVDDRLKGITKSFETLKKHETKLLEIYYKADANEHQRADLTREYAQKHGLSQTNTLDKIKSRIDSHIDKFGDPLNGNKTDYFNNIKQNIMEASKEANSIPVAILDQNLKKAQEYRSVQFQLEFQKGILQKHQRNIWNINNDPTLDSRQKFENRQTYARQNGLNENKPFQSLEKHIEKLEKTLPQLKPELLGDKKIHALRGQQEGRFAADLPSSSSDRGGSRAIFEKQGNKLIYADHFNDHNYSECRPDIRNLIPDPFDALRPEHFIRYMMDEDAVKKLEKDSNDKDDLKKRQGPKDDNEEDAGKKPEDPKKPDDNKQEPEKKSEEPKKPDDTNKDSDKKPDEPKDDESKKPSQEPKLGKEKNCIHSQPGIPCPICQEVDKQFSQNPLMNRFLNADDFKELLHF